MKKSIFIVFITLLMIMTGCGSIAPVDKNDVTSDTNNIGITADWEVKSLEEYVESTPYIFEGICTDVEAANYGGAIVSFSPEKVYQGNIDDTSVILHSMDATPFSSGSRYIIFARKSTSVFVGYEYYSVENLICEENAGVYEGSISDAKGTLSELRTKLEECLKEHSYTGEYTVEGEYCKSDNITEIYNYSTNVILVTVEAIDFNNSKDRTSYKITCDKNYKGNKSDITYVVAAKDSLEVGKQYILLLTVLSDDSLISVISSQNSVVLPGSENAKLIESMAETK